MELIAHDFKASRRIEHAEDHIEIKQSTFIIEGRKRDVMQLIIVEETNDAVIAE